MRRLLLAPFLALACLGAPVIPRPASVEAGKGALVLSGAVPVSAEGAALPEARALRGLLKAAAGLDCVEGPVPGRPGVRLVLDPAVEAGEGYDLTVGDEVEIRARTPQGLFYGGVTLGQMAFQGAGRGGTALPRMRIRDYPRFSWRGMHLDVSRHFYPVATIKAFLDALALHKMNVFHWHLSDDHGWRLEIKSWPRLAEFAAWREPKDADHVLYDRDRSQDPARRTYGGFYTQEEAREVVAYAAERHILVVPEIEMPAHSMAVLDAYPDLACSGRPYVPPADLRAETEFTDPFCAGNPRTFQFVSDVLREVAAIFPSPWIHVGGDEARKAPWLACPKCRALMAAQGLKDGEALQSWFMRRVEGILASLGRKSVCWDEVLEGGLPASTRIMVWRDWLGDRPLAASLAQGHETIATPANPLYFSSEPEGGAGEDAQVARLKRLLAFDPAPERLGPRAKTLMLGAEGCIWTEHIHSGKEVLQTLLPALCPLAEALWSGPGPWPDFAHRLDAHFPFLDRMGVDYRVLPPLDQGSCGNVGSREGGYLFAWPSRPGGE